MKRPFVSLLVFALAAFTATAKDFAFLTRKNAGDVMPMGELESAFERCKNAKAVWCDAMPTDNLLDVWKNLGIKVFLRVRFDPEVSPEFFRRQAGFEPFLRHADGAYLDFNGSDLDPAAVAALKEAKEDIRIVTRVRDLAERAAADKDYLVVEDGRQAKFLLNEIGVSTLPPGLLRLEMIALLKHLEEILGEKPLAVEIAEGETPARKVRPFKGAKPEAYKLAFGTEVKLSDAVSVRLHPKELSFIFTDGKFDSKPGALLPKDRREFSFRLYTQIAHDDWARYDVRWRSGVRNGEGKVSQGCTASMAIHVSDKFTAQDAIRYGYGTPWGGVVDVEPTRASVPGAPRFGMSAFFETPNQRNKLTGSRINLSMGFSRFLARLPASDPVRPEYWYLDIPASPWTGGERVTARLDFPKSGEPTKNKLLDACDCGAMTGLWQHDCGLIDWLYTRSWLQRFRVRPKDTTPRMYCVEADKMFIDRMVAPIRAPASGIAKLVFCDKDNPTPLLAKRTPQGQRQIRQQCYQLAVFFDRVMKLRADYLKLRFAGKEPPEPPKPKESEADAKKDALAPEEEETISLDEEL